MLASVAFLGLALNRTSSTTWSFMLLILLAFQPRWTSFQISPPHALRQSCRAVPCSGSIHGEQATHRECNRNFITSCDLSSSRTRSKSKTQDSAYKMGSPNRSGRGDTRNPTSLEGSGIEHGRKPWSKRQYFPTEGDVHLSS